MDTEELCRSLITLMEREAALLEHVVGFELTLKESVVAQDWTGLERAQGKLNPILEKVGAVEEKRHAAFEALCGAVGEPADSGFYEVLVHLDRTTRERAAATYRTLKFAVLKIQGMTNSIDIYLSTITGAMQEILAELFPFRKGKLYTRSGTASRAQDNPMVISRSL